MLRNTTFQGAYLIKFGEPLPIGCGTQGVPPITWLYLPPLTSDCETFTLYSVIESVSVRAPWNVRRVPILEDFFDTLLKFSSAVLKKFVLLNNDKEPMMVAVVLKVVGAVWSRGKERKCLIWWLCNWVLEKARAFGNEGKKLIIHPHPGYIEPSS